MSLSSTPSSTPSIYSGPVCPILQELLDSLPQAFLATIGNDTAIMKGNKVVAFLDPDEVENFPSENIEPVRQIWPQH